MKRRIELTLELPDNVDAWPMIALRRCLKALLRSYGLRCIDITEQTEPSEPGDNGTQEMRC